MQKWINHASSYILHWPVDWVVRCQVFNIVIKNIGLTSDGSGQKDMTNLALLNCYISYYPLVLHP